jgi:hypothetical protein
MITLRLLAFDERMAVRLMVKWPFKSSDLAMCPASLLYMLHYYQSLTMRPSSMH